MTVREARGAAGAALLDPDAARGPDGCRYVRLKDRPGLLFMVEGERVVRVETRDRRYRTASGARVGDGQAAVRRLYRGRFEEGPHKYLPAGRYLAVRSPDRTHAMVLETDGKRVVLIRSGSMPAAEYVEGCS
jgi:hypothetical protein